MCEVSRGYVFFLQNYVTCALGIHFIGFTMMCFGACDSLCSYVFGKIAPYTGRIALFCLGMVTYYYYYYIKYYYYYYHSHFRFDFGFDRKLCGLHSYYLRALWNCALHLSSLVLCFAYVRHMYGICMLFILAHIIYISKSLNFGPFGVQVR